MPPRKTTDFGALFEALVEDLRIQLAASVDRAFADVNRRLTRLERRLDLVHPEGRLADNDEAALKRPCSLCDRPGVARGLCSAHYQQWRYRERRAKLVHRAESVEARRHGKTPPVAPVAKTNVFSAVVQNIASDN